MLVNKIFILLIGLIIIFPAACREKIKPGKDYPIQPVPFTAVHINDAFWQERLETNRGVTIPYAFKKCEETGRIHCTFNQLVAATGRLSSQNPNPPPIPMGPMLTLSIVGRADDGLPHR